MEEPLTGVESYLAFLFALLHRQSAPSKAPRVILVGGNESSDRFSYIAIVYGCKFSLLLSTYKFIAVGGNATRSRGLFTLAMKVVHTRLLRQVWREISAVVLQRFRCGPWRLL